MERDKFVFKTQVSYAISTDDSDFEPSSISSDLQLIPTRMHKKGETWIGPRTGYVSTRPSTVWAIDSEWTILEDPTVSHHIDYFKSLLLSKLDTLKKYKEDDRFSVSFWIWIETDYGGIGFGLYEYELTFLNAISNFVSFSLLTADEIT